MFGLDGQKTREDETSRSSRYQDQVESETDDIPDKTVGSKRRQTSTLDSWLQKQRKADTDSDCTTAVSTTDTMERSMTDVESDDSEDFTSTLCSEPTQKEPAPHPVQQDNIPGHTSSKQKGTGAAKYKSRFKRDFSLKWPCIQPVKGDLYKFECTLCKCCLSCAHMGEGDIRRHISGRRHTESVKEHDKLTLQKPLGLPTVNSALAEKVTLLITERSLIRVSLLLHCFVLGNSC
jgi:hypothetical protein